MNSAINPRDGNGYSSGNDSDIEGAATHKHTADADADVDTNTPSYNKRQRHAKSSGTTLNSTDSALNSTSPRSKSKGKPKSMLDEEARNKRAAQNRAAQRAFRERKERKMRELQDKVNQLQKVQQQNEVESEFLRGQLAILVGELKKYRPETANDSKVLSYLSHYDMSLGANGSNVAFSFTYPWNKDNNNNNKNNQQQQQQQDQQRRDIGSNSSYLSSVRTPDTCPLQETGLQSVTPLTDTFSASGSGAMMRANSLISDNSTPNIGSCGGGKSGSMPVSIPAAISGTKLPMKRTNASVIPNVSLKNSSSLFGGGGDNVKSGLKFETLPAAWFENFLGSDDFLNQQQLLVNLTELSKSKEEDSSAGIDASRGPNSSTVDRLDSYDDSNLFSNNFNFNDRFDEQVSDFCVKMNQACGTRHNPIPKSKNILASAATPQSTDTNENANNSNSVSLASSNENSAAGTPAFGDMYFCNNFGKATPVGNDKNLTLGANDSAGNSSSNSGNVPFMNPALAFPGETIPGIPTGSSVTSNDSDNNLFMDQFLNAKRYNDTQYNFYDSDEDDRPFRDNSGKFNSEDPLSSLVREEPSAYAGINPKEDSDDNLGLGRHHSNNTSITDMDDDDDNDDAAVVPDKGDTLLRCSEIWDRITTHPKYSDLDIDGLCSELMSKAKCSEKGVVVNANDVQVALNKHLI